LPKIKFRLNTEIQQKNNPKPGIFFIEKEGIKVAKMIDAWAEDE